MHCMWEKHGRALRQGVALRQAAVSGVPLSFSGEGGKPATIHGSCETSERRNTEDLVGVSFIQEKSLGRQENRTPTSTRRGVPAKLPLQTRDRLQSHIGKDRWLSCSQREQAERTQVYEFANLVDILDHSHLQSFRLASSSARVRSIRPPSAELSFSSMSHSRL